jgi:hypothetical protein
LAIADKKIALNAGWDETLLTEILTDISVSVPDFDLEITGFETSAFDGLLHPEPKADPIDEFDDTVTLPITRVGDLWLLGEHLILCASALEVESYRLLMGKESAQLTITDPP